MNEFSTEPIEELGVITGDAAVNEIEEVFYPPSEFDKNEAQNIIQDGSLFAESFNAGVVRAKVVEDTSYARSIRPANVGGRHYSYCYWYSGNSMFCNHDFTCNEKKKE